MKSYRKELWFEIPTRRAFINMTPQVNACLKESGIKEGLVLINAMHITASVFITTATYMPHPPPDLPLERGGIGKTSMKVRKTHKISPM